MSTNNRCTILLISFFISFLFSSGGYDHGTATGKGKLQVDLTWNPQDMIKYGQTYVVVGYGISDRIDIHGFVAHHPSGFETWYMGVFYQFLKWKRLDLATAVGTRKLFGKKKGNLFFPQLLYTIHISENIYFGGSLVNLMEDTVLKKRGSIGVAIDFALFFKLPYQSKWVEKVSLGFGGFHPVTYDPGYYFLPTYSLDILFRKSI